MSAAANKSGGGSSIPGIILVGLGAFLITLALALAFFVVPGLKKTPLDTEATSITESVPGNLLIGRALLAGEPLESNADKPECQAPAAAPEDDEDEPAAGDDAEGAEEGAAEGTDEENGEDDAAAGGDEEAGLPVSCFIENGVPIHAQRHVTAVEPSDSDVVTFQAAQSLLRDDLLEGDGADALVSASIDRVTLDRVSSNPVDEPTSTTKLASSGDPSADPAPPGYTRNGLQYKFPFDVEQTTYDYFDLSTFTTNPIDFVEETELNGVSVYKFEQEIGPIDMFQSIRDHFAEIETGYSPSTEAVLASYKRPGTAGEWGLEGDADREVEMTRYYTNKRTLYVSPVTGQILNGEEEQFQFFAEDQAEADAFFEDAAGVAEEKENPTRTAVYFSAAWDQETQDTAAANSQDAADTISTAGTMVPLVLGVLGVLAIIGGAILGLRNRRD